METRTFGSERLYRLAIMDISGYRGEWSSPFTTNSAMGGVEVWRCESCIRNLSYLTSIKEKHQMHPTSGFIMHLR